MQSRAVFPAVLALFLCVLFESECAKSKEYQAYQEHSRRVRQFPCAVPRKTVISLDNIFLNEIRANQKLDPPVSVLHRCDFGAGCCPPHQTCGPATSQMVKLVFQVVTIDSLITRGVPQLKFQMMPNHTSCACFNISDQPK